MNPHPPQFPSFAEGLAFHLRLQTQDPDAPADVCRAYLGPLLALLAARFPREDPTLWGCAAERALFDYVRHPERYDPSRSDLIAYLRMAARRDLVKLRSRESRHHRGRTGWNSVELGPDGGNIPGREEDPSERLEHEEEAERCREYLKAVAAGLSASDARVLELMLAGERANPAFAEVLGATELPDAEQDREVKRAKDRIRQRIKRGGWRDE